MPIAVGQKLRRQMRQVTWHVLEMRDPPREHHSPSLDLFAIVQLQTKSIRRALDARNDFVFEFRHHAISDGEAILAKRREAHRNSHVGVLDSTLGAKLL